MTIETTYILKADEGKILRRKGDGLETPSVWLRIGESKDDWEEIDLPKENIEEPQPEDPDQIESPMMVIAPEVDSFI